jgi:signal transduction histidine kinase
MSAKRDNKDQDGIQEGLVEEQQRAIKEFYRKVLLLLEEEKRRVSRDLHDETGQIVISLGAALNILEKELKNGNIERALSIVNENRKMIQEIAEKMKSMVLNLRPPALGLLGLSAVLREYFSQCTKSTPLKIEFNENLKDAKIGEDIEISLYRIVQEAIANILKYAEATKVKVELFFAEKKLRLIIEDNGKGFDFEGYTKQRDLTKIGLVGIKERVSIFNGDFSVESGPGRGTKISITLPLG